MADIEFLAQYWALAWALRYPPLVMFSDTIRQLESVASADLVPQTIVDTLTAAYRAYRERTHRMSLEGGRTWFRRTSSRRARRGERHLASAMVD